IIHAHVHMVPTNGVGLAKPQPEDRGWFRVDVEGWLATAHLLSQEGGGYAYWHSPTEGRFLRNVVSPPSQYLRQHVARELGVRNWDWRKAGSERALLDTLDLLR